MFCARSTADIGRPFSCDRSGLGLVREPEAIAMTKKLRVLIAKIGLDGHDRGVKIVARALRDGGLEVVYLGIHNTPQEIVSAAIQEDVDAVGLSVHSAAHLPLFKDVLRLLKVKKASKIVLFGGGIIPPADIRTLKKIGVKELFTPGTPLEEIVGFVRSLSRKGKSRVESRE